MRSAQEARFFAAFETGEQKYLPSFLLAGEQKQKKKYPDRRKRREGRKMAEIYVDGVVDITDVVCPITFVKAKVALEELDDGQVLSIRLNDGEPVQNVPRSIKEEGHQVLKLLKNDDGTYQLLVRKTGD